MLVNLPFSDDEPRQTLEDVFAEVAAETPTPVCLSRAQGVLSELFAPHDPPVQQVPGLMIWMVQHGSFNGWIEQARAAQAAALGAYGGVRERGLSATGHGAGRGAAE